MTIGASGRAELRQIFIQAALPAMISSSNAINYAQPEEKIANNVWNIADKLAKKIEEQLIKEEEEEEEESKRAEKDSET